MQIDYGTLITMALQVVITVLLPVILAKLVVFINAKTKAAVAKIPLDQLEYAVGLVYQLVLAAEQSGLTGAIENIGAQKKQWVLDRAQAELDRQGLNIPLETLEALVEGAVKDAFGKIEIPAEIKTVVG